MKLLTQEGTVISVQQVTMVMAVHVQLVAIKRLLHLVGQQQPMIVSFITSIIIGSALFRLFENCDIKT